MRDAFAVKQAASAKTPAARTLRAAALAGAAFAALALGGCLGYEGTHYRGYVIDAKTMDQVRVGASAEQVLVVMGTPSTTSTIGGDAWYYISQKTERTVAFQQPRVTDQRIFAVYFDKNKKVQPRRQLRHGGRPRDRLRDAHDADGGTGVLVPAQHVHGPAAVQLTGHGAADIPKAAHTGRLFSWAASETKKAPRFPAGLSRFVSRAVSAPESPAAAGPRCW